MCPYCHVISFRSRINEVKIIKKWFCSLFAIRISPITHLVLSPPPPPTKNVRNPYFPFLLGTTTVPRETENNAYAKLGGGIIPRGNLGDVRVADVMPVNCNKKEPCYGSTIKISLNPFWVWARKCIVPQIFLDHKRFANDPERTWTEIIPLRSTRPSAFPRRRERKNHWSAVNFKRAN